MLKLYLKENLSYVGFLSKTKKVLVVTKTKANEASEAEYCGAEDMLEKIEKENWFDFDTIIATPEMMPALGKLGKVLGPKGLMPNPKTGTVTPNVAQAVKDAKAGKVEYRLDKNNIIHLMIGKVSFTDEQLQENFDTIVGAILKAKPAAAKGQYVKSISLSATMGPGVSINPAVLG